MLSVEVNDSLVRIIDNAVKKSGFYSSRSEFLKDAIRKNLLETLMLDKDFRKVHEAAEELRKKAYARGYDGRMPTKAERNKIAREFIKERNLK